MLSSCSFTLRGLSRFSINLARKSLVSFNVSQPLNRTLFPAASFSFGDRFTSVRHRSSRSRRGLYDGKDIRSGNNVSFSMKTTKRKFKPNVFKKRVYSEILNEMIQFHLTTSTLRSIDKAGGLDNYLMKSRHVTNEGEGYDAKKRIMKVMKKQKKMEALAAAEQADEECADEEIKQDSEAPEEGKSRKDDDK
mmetsp:Transcript_18616/g.33711  ORF Transcript_18616/g.33711 Transcript_18616/m.33711 type:complete len:192 (-) Transcript_18616:42-617(-)